VKSGGDFKAKLKKSDPPKVEVKAKGGEQVDFRDKLKRGSVSKSPTSPQESKVRGGEQVDFRTALTRKTETITAEKKSLVGGEQVDFRGNLQKKVQTRTLADKNLSAEQVDFRTQLKKSNSVDPSEEVVKSPPPPVSPKKLPRGGEQVDFRTVLKKTDVTPSRKNIGTLAKKQESKVNETSEKEQPVKKQEPVIVKPEPVDPGKTSMITSINIAAKAKEKTPDPAPVELEEPVIQPEEVALAAEEPQVTEKVKTSI
jgi:hypothetical protein